MGFYLYGKEVKKMILDGKEIESLTINGKIVKIWEPLISQYFWTAPIDFVNKYNGGWLTTLKVPNIIDWPSSPKQYFIKITHDIYSDSGEKIYYKGGGSFGSPDGLYWVDSGKRIRYQRDRNSWQINNFIDWVDVNHQTNYDDKTYSGNILLLPGIKNIIYDSVGFTAVGDPAPVTENVIVSENLFTGTFSSQAKEAEFLSVTTTVSDSEFINEYSLTGIELPNTITIGANSFANTDMNKIHIPKATTIGDGAFSNSVDTNYIYSIIMNHKFNTMSEINRIFGSNLYTDLISWTNDDGTPWVTSNSFVGNWASPDKQALFPTITDTVLASQFIGQEFITGIGLLNVITIGNYAFAHSPLTILSLPKATTIGDEAFRSIVNAATTEVTMNKKFNTDAEKDRIFGAGHWSNINFKWLNDDGTIFIPNSFTGTFSTPAKEAEFMAIITTVSDDEFINEDNLTGINLPNANYLGANSFKHCDKIAEIRLPKVINFGLYALLGVNSRANVYINKTFNTNNWKDHIFGAYQWFDITFHWLNDDGTPATT